LRCEEDECESILFVLKAIFNGDACHLEATPETGAYP
jgi:hypothetical protein